MVHGLSLATITGRWFGETPFVQVSTTWPRSVRKWFIRDHLWWGRWKPGCRIVGSVTTVWLTTEGCVIVSAKCYRWTDIRTDPLQLHRHCSTYYMVTANNRLNGRLWAACLMLSKSLNYLLSLTAVAQWWKCVQELQQKVETASVYTRYRKYRTYPEHRHRNIIILQFAIPVPSVLWHCWLGIRKSIRPVKIEQWGVVICLKRDADRLHMVQLMPLHPKTLSSLATLKSRLVLPFCYRFTQVSWKRDR